jgi:hypothetical protein
MKGRDNLSTTYVSPVTLGTGLSIKDVAPEAFSVELTVGDVTVTPDDNENRTIVNMQFSFDRNGKTNEIKQRFYVPDGFFTPEVYAHVKELAAQFSNLPGTNAEEKAARKAQFSEADWKLVLFNFTAQKLLFPLFIQAGLPIGADFLALTGIHVNGRVAENQKGYLEVQSISKRGKRKQ